MFQAMEEETQKINHFHSIGLCKLELSQLSDQMIYSCEH